MTNAGKGHSLWLVPSQPARTQLQRAIKKISRKEHSPAFIPHITLLSGFNEKNIVAKTAALAKELRPFTQPFNTIGTRNMYFRALFLHANKTKTLRHARNVAENIFKKKTESYMPHLSLLYAEKTPAEKKQIIAQLPKLPKRCVIDTLMLYNCTGRVHQWKLVKTFKLRSSDSLN